MKTARLLTLFLLAALILCLAILLKQQKQSSLSIGREQTGQKLFPHLALNDITKIQFVKTNQTITLSKIGSTWRVEEKFNYPANFSLIREFLIKMGEAKVVQSVPVRMNQWGQLNLVSPQNQGAATLVQLFKDSNPTSFYIGKNQEGSPGRYVRLPQKNESIYLVNEPFIALNYKLEDWLDKQWIHPQKIASITMKPADKPEWKLVRTNETNAFELAAVKKEKLDSAKIDKIIQSLSSLNFNDVLETNAVTILSAFKASSRIEIKTFEGNFYRLAIGSQTNQNYYIKIETDKKEEKQFENYIYLIPKSLLESVLQP